MEWGRHFDVSELDELCNCRCETEMGDDIRLVRYALR